jgi:uncharacterized protein YidB (DUF937 family)
MTKTKKLVGAAAIAAGVGIGTIAGAMFGTPTLSGAAELAATAEAHGGGGPASLEAAAEAIGISVDDLRTAVRDGQTIAEVAAANGVDAQVVIDALVADATARIDERLADGDITQEQADEHKADLAERMTALVNGELGAGDGPGFGRFGPGRGHWLGHGAENVADIIGISEDDLRAALEDGQSLAQIAEANGVARQDLVDALVADATERIESMVDRTWGD